MATLALYGLTAVWFALLFVVATDWRGLRSRRPYAYSLVAVGGVLYVAREWASALGTLGSTAEVALALGSNLAFLAALGVFAWRWWGYRQAGD